MTKKYRILQSVKTRLETVFGSRISKVVLFGSQAKNTANKNSDFDILIVTSDLFKWQERGQIRDICYEIALEYDILIDSKIISQTEIETKFWGKHPLITDALVDGIYAS
ncbi:MAG: nucleotidyltransferase domain-containing protein [Draconibacterium sp.]